MTKIPTKNISKDEIVNLNDIETNLKRVIFGQDKAISVISNAIKLSRVGLRDETKLIWLFSVYWTDRSW